MKNQMKRYRTYEDFEREELNGSIYGLEELHEGMFDFVEDLDERDENDDIAELPF